MRRWIQHVLSMRPTERHDAYAFGNQLPQQVARKRAMLTYLFGCHLGVVGRVNDEAKKGFWRARAKQSNRLSDSVHKRTHVR